MQHQTVESVLQQANGNTLLTLDNRVDIGLHLLASLRKSNQHVADILTDMFDADLCLALWTTDSFEIPESLEQGITEVSVDTLNDIKSVLSARQHGQDVPLPTWMISILGGASGGDRPEREALVHHRLSAARQAFNSQHAPAPEGTVKEIAAKYGVSLGEVRRLKAAGQLHTLTQGPTAEQKVGDMLADVAENM